MEVAQPTAKHTHTIINLHGRDSNAAEYRRDFEESETTDGRTLRDVFPGVKWVYSTAPQILSKRFEVEMSQFFDMWTTEDPHERGEDQVQDLMKSAAAIKRIVLEEGKEIGLQNVILCGISQGAATAVTTLLGLEESIGGFIGFATWLPPYATSLQTTRNVTTTPVFLGHCSDDEIIGIKFGKALSDHLDNLGMTVTWKTYEDGGHWINEPKGVDDVVAFLSDIIE